MTYKEHFISNFDNDPTDMKRYWEDAFGLIQEAADKKGIEFDGYLHEKWEDAAENITQFNEYYFEDENRIKLYVYLSALYNEEIMNHLKDAYKVASLPEPTEVDIKAEVDALIKAGTRF